LTAGESISLTNISASVVNVYNQSIEVTAQLAGEPIDLNPQFDAAKACINQYATSAAVAILDRLENDNAHRFPDSQQAYQAVISSILRPSSNLPEPAIPNVAVAAVGAAVLIQNLQDESENWYVIEETTDIKPSLNETAKSSAVAQAVLGKSVGEEVEIKEAFGTLRRVRIAKILHKWVFRFQQCLDQMPVKFPDQTMFKKFTVNERLPVNERFREILGFMDHTQVQREGALKQYRDHFAMPLSLLAAGLGVSVFAAMAQIVSSKDTYLRCCTGAALETSSAEAALLSAAEIVLEPTCVGMSVIA
jgi:transcription elongation GreA/GreB family factor